MTFIAHIGAGVIGACLLDTLVFHRPPTTETLGLAVGLSLLPDLDVLAVAALKRNWPFGNRKNEHHTSFTHTPFFYMAIALILAQVLPVRWVVFFVALTMLHLALDSWATDDGIMWLWPHTNRQYALLPVPVRHDDIYGPRFYGRFYFEERRPAAWAEVGLAMMGLVAAASTLAPLLAGL